MIDKDLLKESALDFGVSLDDMALDRFELLEQRLVRWNNHINLTAITEPDEIVIKHFVDSLSIFSAVDLPRGASVIDVGCGAGFPGLPLLIARPDLDLTFLDSVGKKLSFIKEVMRYNGIIEGTTGDFDSEINKLKEVFQNADAIIVGAGAGLSSSAGYDFGGERLQKYFGDFVEKYGMKDMYTGCFADFETNEERWAYWSRWAWINRYEPIPKDTHKKLLKLLEGKDYFVLTTNIDHAFQRAGFSKEHLCYTQGDFGLFQCSKPCHTDTYDNYATLQKMVREEKNMSVPTELIPHCPRCGREMDFN